VTAPLAGHRRHSWRPPSPPCEAAGAGAASQKIMMALHSLGKLDEVDPWCLIKAKAPLMLLRCIPCAEQFAVSERDAGGGEVPFGRQSNVSSACT
jgi:hypothetical protein